jgi:quercetin dioxygenase-like cupin family protein
VPNVVYVMEGELTVEADGQPPRVYRAGEAFSEGDHWHDGINNGTVPMKAWVVFAGTEGTPVTVRP